MATPFTPVGPRGDISSEELRLLIAIRDRALELAKELGDRHPTLRDDATGLMLDLLNVHQRVGLCLYDFLHADMGDFGHDAFGIYRYFDREKLILTDCFYPRFGVQDGTTLEDVLIGHAAARAMAPKTEA
jgi:hypothetical protein